MTLTREAAARLLASLDRSSLLAEAASLMAEEGPEWVHPATAERLERCAALEDCLRRLLVIRAGRRGVSNP